MSTRISAPNPTGAGFEPWGDVYARLSAADRERPLDAPDLERLATAARLTGRDAESLELWARAHQAWLNAGSAEQAARVAVRLAMRYLFEHEPAQSGGWLARARRLLDDGRRECVEQGYLLLPQAARALLEGDPAASHGVFADAAGIGERYGDRDLTLLGRLGQGRALIRLGEVTRGMVLLDEIMVAAMADEISPGIVGDMYCSVIDACEETFDVRRAQEWTAALTRWSSSQPAASPYRGACLVKRAALLQLRGEWPDALDEAERACDCLAGPPVHRAIGVAWYRAAELHRLRGEAEEAEELYRRGSRWGRDPQPGLALLRLAQGRVQAAAAAIRRVVAEKRDARFRAADLAACVDILLADGDVGAARTAADELAELAETFDAPLLSAMAAQASGAVLLGEGDAPAALAALRRAAGGWRELEAPYESAHIRTLIGLAHRALGDGDTAALELDAARHAFAALGAVPDVRRVEALAAVAPLAGDAKRLTAREIEVLRLVATGRTNRGIAERLGISEKTVARHLSNIFTKLGVSSRAGATAYAYRNELVEPAQ